MKSVKVDKINSDLLLSELTGHFRGVKRIKEIYKGVGELRRGVWREWTEVNEFCFSVVVDDGTHYVYKDDEIELYLVFDRFFKSCERDLKISCLLK